MKQYFAFRLLLSLVFLLALLWGCASEPSTKINIAILTDITQGCKPRSLFSEPRIKDAIGIQDLGNFPDQVTAYTTDITGVDLEAVRTHRLDAKSRIENPNIRAEAITNFLEGILASLRDTSNGCHPRKASSIFKPLRSMAERLGEDSAFVRTIIVLNSDGMENSTVSFLREKDLPRNHEKVAARLEKAYGEFPPVKGYEFILVHQPKEGDGIGTKGIDFWRWFLESKGGKVKISANL